MIIYQLKNRDVVKLTTQIHSNSPVILSISVDHIKNLWQMMIFRTH